MHLVVNGHFDLLWCFHAKNPDQLIRCHQLRLEIRLLEVLERAILAAHRLAQLDMPLAIALARALPGIVVAVLPGNAALVFLNRIFRLIYRDDAFFIEHFFPRGTQTTPDRLEHFDHGEIHGLGHVLRGRSPLCGDL